MRRWLETKGYELEFWLALRGWRRLNDLWAGIWYHFYCPRPLCRTWTARACFNRGECGCNNRDRFKHSSTVLNQPADAIKHPSPQRQQED